VLILNTAITDGWTAPKRFIAGTVGVAGGFLVGGITFLMGSPWWWLPLCAAAGLLIGRVLPSDASNNGARNSGVRRPVHALLRLCRSLPLWDRIAMSALLVVTATAVYIGMRNLHILSAFYLFLLPIVLAQLMFGARCGIAAAFVSLVSIYYFAIPPKNSFALQSLREICLLAAFALLAFITSATLAVQTDIAGIKDDHQPLQ
jgi:Domain of unknown function (DUF4118)